MPEIFDLLTLNGNKYFIKRKMETQEVKLADYITEKFKMNVPSSKTGLSNKSINDVVTIAVIQLL